MKKFQSIPPLASLLIYALTACTRPASYQIQTEAAHLVPPSTATLPAITASTLEYTQAPEISPTAQILPESTESPSGIQVPISQIPLEGLIANPEAEISGMAWYGDLLILLPQYPNHFPVDGEGSVFALRKTEILDFLQGKSKGPLKPFQIPFSAPNLETSIRGFEGFEAIAFNGDQVFMTIEASPAGMMGYLIAGQITSNPIGIRMDSSRLSKIPPQTSLPNFSDEALMVFGSRLISIYEISGGPLNPNPVAHMYDFSLQLQDSLAFPNIPYRISDATPPDDSGRFWAINFSLRGDGSSTPTSETLLEELWKEYFQRDTLVQLVEFQFSEAGIVLSDRPPIQLEPTNHQSSNWEAVARLDELGFVLATDEHPDTILGFVLSP